MKKICFVVAIMSLFLNANFIHATTVTYPADNPIFSIHFPDDWTIEPEENLLHATPADESIYIGLWAMKDVENIEDAIDVMADEIDGFVKGVEVDDPEEMEINGIPFVFIDGSGVIDDDINVELSIAIFSTDGKTFFISLFFGTPDMIEKHNGELKAILESVKASE